MFSEFGEDLFSKGSYNVYVAKLFFDFILDVQMQILLNEGICYVAFGDFYANVSVFAKRHKINVLGGQKYARIHSGISYRELIDRILDAALA